MNRVQEYVDNNITKYYKIVNNPKWVYTDIDEDLVRMVFKTYAQNLNIESGYPNYDETILNMYEYARAKVTVFFKDMHIVAMSEVKSFLITNVSLSGFKTLIDRLADTVFGPQLEVEYEQIGLVTERFRRGVDSIREGRNLKYIAELDSATRDRHRAANGIVAPATDKIWVELNKLLVEWNCRCKVVITRNGDKNAITQDKIDKFPDELKSLEDEENEKRKAKKLAPVKKIEPASTMDFNKPVTDSLVKVFSPTLRLFKEFDIIRRTYKK